MEHSMPRKMSGGILTRMPSTSLGWPGRSPSRRHCRERRVESETGQVCLCSVSVPAPHGLRERKEDWLGDCGMQPSDTSQGPPGTGGLLARCMPNIPPQCEGVHWPLSIRVDISREATWRPLALSLPMVLLEAPTHQKVKSATTAKVTSSWTNRMV